MTRDDIPEDFPAEIARFYDLPDEFYKHLIDSIESGVYLVDRKRRIVYWNGTAYRMSGYSSEEVMGRSCGDGLLTHVDFEGRLLCGDGCPLQGTMEDGATRQADVFMKHKDGHRVPVRVTANPVYDRSGELIGAVETFDDITPDLAARLEIRELAEAASTDTLTGVQNRWAGEQAIAEACARQAREGTAFGMLFIDLDNLKEINDQLGHNAGDAALRVAARTLKSVFRQEDLVVRWGGDEFLVLLRDVDEALLQKLAEKARLGIQTAELPAPFVWGRLSASVGAVMAREGEGPGSIISRADQGMYEEKKRKKAGR